MNTNANDSCIFNLDHELSASVKKVLLHRIVFKEAKLQDAGYISNHKHRPLNDRYKDHVLKSTKKTSLQQQQSEIPKPPIVIFPPDKVELQWKEVRRIGPGLANLGNTCFLNSVLQVLTYTPPLVNYFLSGYHKSNCRVVGFCMQCELADHINKIVRHNNQLGPIRPTSIIQKLKCIGKNFHFGRQEDAHEFLRYVVEAIQKSDYADKPKMDKLSKETTVANAIFGGFYRSQVKCLHCNYESNTFDPMMDLNIDIKDCSNIMQGLQRSVRPDRLDGENKYFCEKCRTKRIAQKRGNIHKEPNVLTLQLKRFDFTRMFGGKVCKEISFPEKLNIRPFMSNSQGEPVGYQLYGVLVHSGFSCNSGHYYCYVRAPNGTWYEMNDNRVSQVGLQTVLHAQAYILFYLKNKSSQNTSHTTVKVPNVAKEKNAKSDANHYTPLKVPENSMNTLVPSIGLKVGSSESVTKRPEIKASGIPNLSDLNPGSTNIQKKKPKINWTQNNIQSEEVSTNDISKTSGPLVPSTPIPSMKAVVKPPLSIEKSVVLNGLQALSQSYGDSDTGDSRESSPPSSKLTGEEIDINNGLNDENHNRTEAEKPPSFDENRHASNAKETQQNKPPFKLKLKEGKQFIHNKFNIWSPITKGTLYPRAILNKCVLNNENDQSKILEKKKKIQEAESSWKEEKMQQSDKLFGPLQPPPPGAICKGSSSITSETSSTGSIQTQSGEWDVLDKPGEVTTPVGMEIKYNGGWNVHPTSSSATSVASGDENSNATNEVKGKVKKKKKKKRKRREEIGEVEVKFVPVSKQQIEGNVESSVDSNTGKNIEKLQVKSSVSLPFPFSSLHSDDEETRHHRKKKKKQRRRYSLVIDTNQDSIGGISIPIELNKSSGKPEIITAGIKSAKSEINIPGLHETGMTKYKSAPKPVANSKKTQDDQQQKDRSIENGYDKRSWNNSSEHLHTDQTNIANTAVTDDMLRETSKNNEMFVKSTVIVSKSYEPLKRDNAQPLKGSYESNHIPQRKRDIVTHVWDDSKKKQCAWDGANKSDTVGYLLSGGSNVQSWDGNERSFIYNKRKNTEGENPQDEWDEDYDKGKARKMRKVGEQDKYNKSKTNSFQDYQNYKNSTKDKQHTSPQSAKNRHSDHHHHHKRHKQLYSEKYNESNRFV